MSRIVRTGQDLSGQTLDASKLPDGHARQSLIRGCSIGGAVFLGDWRGTDFLGNTGAADWSQAETYACYWRGNRELEGSKFPPNIGFLHHQPMAEIIRQRMVVVLPQIPSEWRQKAEKVMKAVVAHVLSDLPTASWIPAYQVALDAGVTSEQFVKLFRLVFKSYDVSAQRFEELVRETVFGDRKTFEQRGVISTVRWPDGAEVTVDATNLPALPENSRYALRRWAEARADEQQPGPHYCFAYRILPTEPPVIIPQVSEDAWLIGPGGY